MSDDGLDRDPSLVLMGQRTRHGPQGRKPLFAEPDPVLVARHAAGDSISQLSRETGLDRRTVRKALGQPVVRPRRPAT